jgi:hypothetical protein
MPKQQVTSNKSKKKTEKQKEKQEKSQSPKQKGTPTQAEVTALRKEGWG